MYPAPLNEFMVPSAVMLVVSGSVSPGGAAGATGGFLQFPFGESAEHSVHVKAQIPPCALKGLAANIFLGKATKSPVFC